MKVGIISDTHGVLTPWQVATTKVFQDVEIILHAGDVLYHGPRNPILEGYNPQELAKAINDSPVPVLIAKGNCDTEVDQMVLNVPFANPYLFTVLEDKRILVNHGHLLGEEELLRLAKLWRIDLCITGHTHIPILENREGVVFFNPGSCTLPKGPGIPTVGLWDNGNLQLVDINRNQIIERYQL